MSERHGARGSERRRSSRFFSAISVFSVVSLVALPIPAAAHETDQYTVPVGKRFADLGEYFNGLVCETLERAVDKTNEMIRQAERAGRGESYLEYLRSHDTLAKYVWQEFTSAYFLIENLESKVHDPAFTQRFPGRVVGYRETIRNIYQHVHFPLDPRQFFRLWHASTMQVYGVYFGPDKFGHFADMGYNYYRVYAPVYNAGRGEEEAIAAALRLGIGDPLFGEEGMVGYGSAGAYSNADMEANYIGLLFYVNLARPQRIKGEMRPPILFLDDGLWRLSPHVRRDLPFFEMFVSDHLNEALNPSLFEKGMQETVREAVRARADKILRFYADANGNRRPREYFDALLAELTTYYGEQYGHKGSPDELVTIGNTCFPSPPGPDDAAPSRNGWSRLHWAAHGGDAAAVGSLLAEGAFVDEPVCSLERASDDWGSTPLHLAAAAGRLETVELLLDAGADVNARNGNGATPLHKAAGQSFSADARVLRARARVVELLIWSGAAPDARDERGRTPLHWLARYPDLDSARALLEAGASPAAADHAGETPLHRAAAFGHTEMMSLLLAEGAPPGAAARFSATPLHLAARGGSTDAAALLLGHGAEIDAADEFGTTALHDAARRGDETMVAFLLGAGAEPSRADAGGSTPLHLAVRGNRPSAAALLVRAGADVNAANASGSVPLHEAVYAASNDLVRQLLAAGADATARDNRGRSAMDLAASCGNTVAFLLIDSARSDVARDRTLGMR